MESFKNIKQMIEIYFYISEIIKRYEKRNKYISLNRVIHPILNESLELKLYGNVDYNCILLISHLLSLQLYISSGSWMSVKFFSKQSTKYEERWVKIIIDYELKDDSMCFIGFTLYNNILRVLGNDDIRIEVNEKTMIDDVYLITRLYLLKNKFSSSHPLMSKYSKSNGPNFASQVKLSLYSKFSSIPSEILEKILFKNFSTPKYVQKGDILCLNLNHLRLQLYLDLEIYPSYIYFLVTSVSGPENSNGYLVLKDKSSLFLDSDPCYINVPNDQLVNENSIPPCLTSVFNNICHIFNLFTSHASSLCEDNITVSNHIEETRIVDGTSNDLRTEDSLVSCTGQVIIIGDKGSGKEEILKFLAQKYCCQIKWINCLTLVGDTSAATEGKLSNALSNISNCQILVFLNIGHLSKDKDGNADPRAFTKMKEHVGKLVAQDVFVAATEENQNKISEEIWSLFAYHAHIPCPTLEERKNTIYWLMNTRGHLLWSSNMSVDCRIKRESLGYTLDFVESASHRTSGFFWKDLEELFLRSLSNAQERIGLENTHAEHLDFLKKDFFLALDEMQEDRSDALNLPSIPVVRWTEIGGLESAKNELRDAIQLPIQCPAAVAMGLGRSGVLLYGPPGTGKTLLAKAVASECGLNFLSVKGPELINMYVGQSEENVREIFEKARAASPCVIFFDEIDSLAPARGRSGDSGGVMDRIVSALLAELDDASSTSDVFVLAATNRPDLLDTSLLRPGRFEKKIYIGLCENVEDRVTLLNAITSKIPLSKNVSLKHVASQLPSTLTGADFAALVNDAFYIAAEREIARIETGVPATDIQVEVTEQDLLNAAALLKPSVSSSDLKMYEEMKNTAQKYKVDR